MRQRVDHFSLGVLTVGLLAALCGCETNSRPAPTRPTATAPSSAPAGRAGVTNVIASDDAQRAAQSLEATNKTPTEPDRPPVTPVKRGGLGGLDQPRVGGGRP